MIGILLCVALVFADHHHDSYRHHSGHHDSERHHSGHHDSGRQFRDLAAAVGEADKLIVTAQELLAVNGLFPGEQNIVARNGNSADSSDNFLAVSNERNHRHGHSSDDHTDNRHLHTSSKDSQRLLQEALEERIVEVAIANALKAAPATTTVQKKPYQARFEITQFDGNDLPNQVINFGPTVITTRRNQILHNTQRDDVMPFFTAADYLDHNLNGVPDIVEALVHFRDTANPTNFTRVLRTRAVKAVVRGPATVRGSIDLINLIQLDGKFSVTNQLVSNCFSATSDAEFVFEAVVGAVPGQSGVLAANPTQTHSILLLGSTALNESDPTFNTPNAVKNIFYQNGAFVESPGPIGLYLNLFDRYIPGPDTIAQQGRVFFGPCSSFNYFQ